MSQAENADAATLEAGAQAKSAFDFVRLEDSAISKTSRARVYIGDTGGGRQRVRPRPSYQLDFDRSDPRIDDDTRATSSDAFKLSLESELIRPRSHCGPDRVVATLLGRQAVRRSL